MPLKLKVFRTAIGFHDAYVAVPSRKAALEAWGATADLFARGVAEEVTDPKLMAGPLKHPGEVMRVSRGDLKAQLKALGPRMPPAERPPKPSNKSELRRRVGKPQPPPKRDKVDRAEAALDAERHKQARERSDIEEQLEALEARLAVLKRRQAAKIARLQDRLEDAQADYRGALERWSD